MRDKFCDKYHKNNDFTLVQKGFLLLHWRSILGAFNGKKVKTKYVANKKHTHLCVFNWI